MNLDVDWGYRRLAPILGRRVGTVVTRWDNGFRRGVLTLLSAMGGAASRVYGPAGLMARHWPTGSMVIWVAVLLAAYLLFYFI